MKWIHKQRNTSNMAKSKQVLRSNMHFSKSKVKKVRLSVYSGKYNNKPHQMSLKAALVFAES